MSFKVIFKDGVRYILRIILGIIISAFILLPVIYTIRNGRNDIVLNINWYDFISKIDLTYLMYDANGLGLSSIVWFSIIYNMFLKKENKLLSFILLLIIGIPLFNLSLNGFLYASGKVFVSFVPLFIILVMEVLKNVNSNKKTFLIFVISLLLSFILIDFNNKMYMFCFELLITYILLYLYKNKNMMYIYIIVFIVLSISLYYSNYRNLNLDWESYNDIYKIINIDKDKYMDDNVSIYRTQYDYDNVFVNYSDASSIYLSTLYSSNYNKKYSEIIYDVFNNNRSNSNFLIMSSQQNLFFNRFMGIKYLYTDGSVPYGYKKVYDFENISLYKNDNVYSLGYASSHLFSYDEYNKLSFIEKILAYQNNIIIDGDSNNSDLDFNYNKMNLDYKIIDSQNIVIKMVDDNYIINSSSDGKLVLKLNKSINNKTLVIRFNVNNDSREHISITINDVKNTLSYDNFRYHNNNNIFDYVISSNDRIDELNVLFSKGIYNIKDIEVYTIDNLYFDDADIMPLSIDFDNTKGDNIYGSVDVLSDGYFIFTIPYDKGYTAYVDNMKVNIEQVNDGFIGFKISEGKHDIHLTYEAPYAKLGRIISLFGIMILGILYMYERKR